MSTYTDMKWKSFLCTAWLHPPSIFLCSWEGRKRGSEVYCFYPLLYLHYTFWHQQEVQRHSEHKLLLCHYCVW